MSHSASPTVVVRVANIGTDALPTYATPQSAGLD